MSEEGREFFLDSLCFWESGLAGDALHDVNHDNAAAAVGTKMFQRVKLESFAGAAACRRLETPHVLPAPSGPLNEKTEPGGGSPAQSREPFGANRCLSVTKKLA